MAGNLLAPMGIAGFFVAVTFMVTTGGFSLMASLSAAISCPGNIGPGFGLAGPGFNFAFSPDYLKYILCFAMRAGRLEVYTVFALFTHTFWKK
jgi:trk system potassium uptake protein TrkH